MKGKCSLTLYRVMKMTASLPALKSKHKFTLEQATKDQMGSKDITLPFL